MIRQSKIGNSSHITFITPFSLSLSLSLSLSQVLLLQSFDVPITSSYFVLSPVKSKSVLGTLAICSYTDHQPQPTAQKMLG
jgi:hypothetical protein